MAEKEGLHDAGAVGVLLGTELERVEHTVDVADQLEQFARVEEGSGPVGAVRVFDEDHLEVREGLDQVWEITMLVVVLVGANEHTACSGRVEAHADDSLEDIGRRTTKCLVSTLE